MRRRAEVPFLAAAALAALALAAPVRAQQPTVPQLEQFLLGDVALTAAERATIDRGAAISKILRTTNGRDVTVFAVVRVNVPRALFEQRNADFAASLKAPRRFRLGVFGDPPRLEDVAEIVVTPDDFKELKDCKPNDCSQKVPSVDMSSMQARINWSAPDAAARVTDYVRQRVVEYVADYRTRGNAAMVDYADRGRVQASKALEEMLSDSLSLYRYIPSLRGYLLDYPRARLPGATEAVYWAADDLPRMRPVLKIAQQVVYSPPELVGATIVTNKLIYANHYFEAGIESLMALEHEFPSGQKGILLMAMRSYRFDQLPGGLLNIRQRVSNAVRDVAREDLARMKSEYEAAQANRGGR